MLEDMHENTPRHPLYIDSLFQFARLGHDYCNYKRILETAEIFDYALSGSGVGQNAFTMSSECGLLYCKGLVRAGRYTDAMFQAGLFLRRWDKCDDEADSRGITWLRRLIWNYKFSFTMLNHLSGRRNELARPQGRPSRLNQLSDKFAASDSEDSGIERVKVRQNVMQMITELELSLGKDTKAEAMTTLIESSAFAEAISCLGASSSSSSSISEEKKEVVVVVAIEKSQKKKVAPVSGLHMTSNFSIIGGIVDRKRKQPSSESLLIPQPSRPIIMSVIF